VRVNGAPAKPSTLIGRGDRVTARVGGRERVLEVVEVIEKRVGAALVASCLLDHSPPPPTKEERLDVLLRDPSTGRPTKRDRRQIDRLRGR
jgi:ribosome-associated heat shock protein Hsp15